MVDRHPCEPDDGNVEAERLLKMEARLHERIIGQDEAIHAVADAIRRARSGTLKDPRRPIGSFIFIDRQVLARPNWPRRSPSSCSMTRKRLCAST